MRTVSFSGCFALLLPLLALAAAEDKRKKKEEKKDKKDKVKYMTVGRR